MKKRVLVSSEFSLNATGYSRLAKGLLSFLHSTGEFELTELASYVSSDDPRVGALPWRVVPVMPGQGDQAGREQYQAHPFNQFGKLKFEETAIQSRADATIVFRDYWMMETEFSSPLRPYYRLLCQCPCDSAPQNPEWLAMFKSADLCLAYSDWGKEVLERESGGRIRILGEAPVGVDLNTYRPKPKRQQKQKLGLDPDCFLIGFVARNNYRKLYPDLAEAIALFLKQAPPELAKKTFFYWHVAYPDMGWNIPQLLKDYGIGHKVLFTYQCHGCGACFPSFYADVWAPCKHCQGPNSRLARSDQGVPDEVLADIYGALDALSQYVTAEGQGIPMVEASACGVPVFATDYSACSDVVRKLNGYPIKVGRMFKDHGTTAWRALPDNQDFVNQLIYFLGLPEIFRLKKGMEARQGAEKWYNWGRFGKTYYEAISSLGSPELPWDAPPRLHQPNTNIPAALSDANFVRWGLVNVAGRPDLVGTWVELKMMRDLYWRNKVEGLGGAYINECSILSQQNFPPYTRERALNEMMEMASRKNFFEKRRWEVVSGRS